MLFKSFEIQTIDTIKARIEDQLEQLYKFKLVAKKQITFKPTDHIDDVSFCLINRSSYFKPVVINGDGNCFFRFLSKALYGTEDHHFEMRYRTLCELVMRK